MHSENKYSIDFTNDVSNNFKFIFFNEIHPENKESIYKIFLDSKLDKSKDNQEEQPENIWYKFISDIVVISGKLIEVKELQPLNIYFIEDVEDILKLFKFNSNNEEQS